MSIKIGKDSFKNRINKGLDDTFMRSAVGSAQDRLKAESQSPPKNLAIGKIGAHSGRKFGNTLSNT